MTPIAAHLVAAGATPPRAARAARALTALAGSPLSRRLSIGAFRARMGRIVDAAVMRAP